MMDRRLSDLVSPLRLVLVALAAAVVAAPAAAQVAELIDALNERVEKGVPMNRRSAPIIAEAYLDLTEPPMSGIDFNLTTIHPDMDRWEEVADWAASNEKMREAILEAQNAAILAMPYGESRAPRAWRSKDFVVRIAPDGDVTQRDYPYLDCFDLVASYATAEMYRLLEAGEHEDAMLFGVAFLRVLRQGCEQEFIAEKEWFMETLSDALTTHRDAMWRYREAIPAQLFNQLGLKEYPFLRPTDNERMKQLTMPEGDRLLAEALLRLAFDEAGQAKPEDFASTFGRFESKSRPLARFGTLRRWRELANVHASYDASLDKLTDVYDDWWRRWRMRQYDQLMGLETEFSRLNRVRFAAVQLAVADLENVFRSRERLVTNINGTAMAAGICGYRQTFNGWPNEMGKVYAVHALKRFDFDPYDREYGRLTFRAADSQPFQIQSDYGRLSAEGSPLLYGKGRDNTDDRGNVSSNDGSEGDLLVWPPVRQLAREQGLLD